jgi:Mor family transcriptional regulator
MLTAANVEGNRMKLEKVSHLLPPVVQELVELVGYHETEQLIAALGGTSFLVSKLVRTAGSRNAGVLAQTVSTDAARKIAGRFGGEELYIPRCDAALREWRNQRFIAEYNQMLAAGDSGRYALMTLCPRYQISDRQAKKILIKYRENGTQLDLF